MTFSCNASAWSSHQTRKLLNWAPAQINWALSLKPLHNIIREWLSKLQNWLATSLAGLKYFSICSHSLVPWLPKSVLKQPFSLDHSYKWLNLCGNKSPNKSDCFELQPKVRPYTSPRPRGQPLKLSFSVKGLEGEPYFRQLNYWFQVPVHHQGLDLQHSGDPEADSLGHLRHLADPLRPGLHRLLPIRCE